MSLNSRAQSNAKKKFSKQADEAAKSVKRVTVHMGLLIEKCGKFRDGVMEVGAVEPPIAGSPMGGGSTGIH